MSARRPRRSHFLLGLGIVSFALAAAWTPMPVGWVERFYSTAVYPRLQSVVTGLSNLAPFALFDALIVVVSVAWAALAFRDFTSGPQRALSVAARIASRTAVWAAALYVGFLIVWGLNYRRLPLADKLAFDERDVTSEAARALAVTAIDQLNKLHADAHHAGWPRRDEIDLTLADALAAVDRDTGGGGGVVPGRPKASFLDWYFRRTATDGMTNPFLLETLVSTTLLPFERPFVVAHEWSHLAGHAAEGDANFVAWLACLRASPSSQYSGWLFLYSTLMGQMGEGDRASLATRLDAGPRADLAAIRARVAEHISPRLAVAGRRVYDQYLKANRVPSGVQSYDDVVRLALGVRFKEGRVPELR